LVKVEYWHKDHLGSLFSTTDHIGAVTARYAYDPFGKRRYTNGSYDAAGNVVADWNATNAGTDRGFTGEEQLDDVGVVHMNGRLFDPTLGLFISPTRLSTTRPTCKALTATDTVKTTR
jgi:RHS repeat-associated protein